MANGPLLLVIDDDQALLCMISAIATQCGYDVVASEHPEDVMAEIGRYDPAVVISDLVMPSLDGVELMRQLANAKISSKVMLVSLADAKTLNAACRLGREYGLDMVAPLQKPFDAHELRARLLDVRATLREISPAELRDALTLGQLEVRYQPKVSLKEGHRLPVVGAEALVRWHHPSRGLLSASRFIPMAEREGLVEPLSLWVLTQVIDQLGSWEKRGFSEGTIAVNIPAGLLDDIAFPDRIGRQLAEASVRPHRLMLEVTEGIAISDGPAVADVLTRLRLKNIALSIDDFGVGHSSMVELYRMPFSELKIDAAFVRDMTTSKEARIIVKALISMSHELGLEVCAEGVESVSVLADLQALGCDKAQGFLFGAAEPAADFERTLALSVAANIAAE